MKKIVPTFLLLLAFGFSSNVFTQSAWTVYNTSNSNIPNNNINQLVIDAIGNKWIVTNVGLSKYDGTIWTNYNTSNSGIASNSISDIEKDDQNNIWIGTIDGMSKFDGTNWTTYKTSNSGIASNIIGDIEKDAQNNIWILTDRGLNKFNGTTWTQYNIPNAGFTYIGFLTIDNQGNKWIGTDAGLSKFDGTTWTTITTRVIRYKQFIDSQGNIWIFDLGGSLDKFNGTNWINISDAGVFDIAMDAQGNIWYGKGQELKKFDGTTWTSYNSTINISGNITIDAQGNKWILQWGGVTKFDGTTWTTYNNSNSIIENNNINQIEIDAQGNKWITTNGQGLIKLTGDGNSNLCSGQNEILPSYNKLCNNSTVNLSSKLNANNYNYLWSGKDNQGNSLNLLNNTQSQITISNSGQYDLKLEDAYCYIKKYINITPLDTLLNEHPICMVTNQNGYNSVVWENINNSYVDKYRIYKQSQQNSNFELVHEQSKNILSQWDDLLSQPNTKKESYKISILDICGRETPLSSIHSTILLSSNVGLNGTVNLAWNAYEGFTYPNFEIWRSTDGINFNMLSTVANNTYAYIDNNPPATAWYQIRVVKQGGCLPSVKSITSVNSNIISKDGKALGIAKISNESFNVFPNPTTSSITITANLMLNNNTFQLIDVSGRSVQTITLESTTQRIDLSRLEKGTYFLKNETGEFKKIVLE